MYAYLWAFTQYAVQMTLVLRRMPKVDRACRPSAAAKAADHG
jgi:hypothetical protein